MIALTVVVRWRRLGIALLWALLFVFYLMSAPFSAYRLAGAVASIPPLSTSDWPKTAQAIVVLSAGATDSGPEFGGIALGSATMERLRYAAHLYRQTPLPILVAGGKIPGTAVNQAEAMRSALEHDFGLPVKWIEDRSVNTAENARSSAAILEKENISAIVLVTHALHMPRALAFFEAAKLRVIPAPTGFPPTPGSSADAIVPRMDALAFSHAALHEALAHTWSRFSGAGRE